MMPAISLDGYIARLNGDSYSWVNPEDEARYQEAVENCGCVLVGRKTYEQYLKDFLAYKNVTVYVCSSQAKPTPKDNIKYVNDLPKEILRQVKSDGFSKIIICGGGDINGLFASHGLVNEIIVGIQPVVLGTGIPLFGSSKPSLNLELISTNQYVRGVVENHYLVSAQV